jgi:two-component system, LytTR family, sensor histidine kinase AlgZ
VHPLLSDRRALAAYLAAWMLLAAVPASILASPGDGLFLLALAAAAPASVLFGLGTLPLYYVCRAVPLSPVSVARVLRLQAALAVAWSVLFLALLEVAARLVDWAVPGADGTLAAEVEGRAGALLAVGAVLYLCVAALHYLVASTRREQSSERRAMSASLQAREAQIALLKAQVHPHFLFNSLHAISALTVESPRAARELCALLADFLRRSLAMGERGMVRLEEELGLARAYLEVERMRLGSRLSVDVQVAPTAGDVPVPALLLQPLVENAITHGVATCAQGGTLSIEAHATPAVLVITVANPFDPAAPPPRGGRGSGGVGLANVSRRIAACYHGATLSTRRDPDRFTATLVLPVSTKETPDGARRQAQGADRR